RDARTDHARAREAARALGAARGRAARGAELAAGDAAQARADQRVAGESGVAFTPEAARFVRSAARAEPGGVARQVSPARAPCAADLAAGAAGLTAALHAWFAVPAPEPATCPSPPS